MTVRIVAVADTHLFQDLLEVPDGDIFVHAGDMCGRGSLTELETAADWVYSLPHRFKVIIAGNHDWAFVKKPDKARKLFARKDTTYLQDAGALILGLRFYGSPWQPQFFDWAFNLPRNGPELTAAWDAIPRNLDVLITHGPPFGYGDRCHDGQRAGCELLLARLAIVTPRLHLYGHIHQDGGTWQVGDTRCVNVTTSECRRAATVIDVGEKITLVDIPATRLSRR